MAKPTPDFRAILQTLIAHQVDFLVAGGVAAVLQGAPISTFDLDLVHSRAPDNVERLLSALHDLDARYRTPGGQRLRPTRTHLLSAGHQLLMTRTGPLDLLGTIGAGRGYSELVSNTVELEIGGGLKIRILALPTLIELKEQLARDKDKAVLAILRRTLEEREKS